MMFTDWHDDGQYCIRGKTINQINAGLNFEGQSAHADPLKSETEDACRARCYRKEAILRRISGIDRS